MSRIAALKKSLHNLRERNAPGLRTTATVAGGGALANIVYGVVSDRIGVLQSAWYYEPLILAAVGHFVRRKHPELGAGILGAAGYAAAQNSRVGQAVRGMVSQNFGAGEAGAALDPGYVQQAIGQHVAGLLAARDAQGYGAQGYGDAGAYVEARGYDAAGTVSPDVGAL